MTFDLRILSEADFSAIERIIKKNMEGYSWPGYTPITIW
jgi:hypothetical protein